MERVHTRLAQRIDRMQHLHGQRLLASIQEIMAHEQLAVQPVIDGLSRVDQRTQANLIYILGYLGGSDAHRAVLPADEQDADGDDSTFD